MSTSAAPLPAVRAALLGLVDYAGLFPPAKLDMVSAVSEYSKARRGAFAWMLGRFIVPQSRLADLRSAIPLDEPPIAVSVILDGAWRDDGLSALSELGGRVRAELLEIPAEADAMQAVAATLSACGFARLPAYVEWPRRPGWGRGPARRIPTRRAAWR